MVNAFEEKIKLFTKSRYAIATVNGTSALHTGIILSGVEANDEVITQSLTFVATVNAIQYSGAKPLFLDVDKDSLSLSPESLESFLTNHSEIRSDGYCWNLSTNRRIKACVIMHTFGLPGRVKAIKSICEKHKIFLIEDAAESLGSIYEEKHTGTIADIGILSFNGNKIITTGGGGMILTQNEALAEAARHLTTTAKLSHPWLFEHDKIGFNYRMPNLNAALGLAQMEKLKYFIEAKRKIASSYQSWGKENGLNFLKEIDNSKSNYWLNTMIVKDLLERDAILDETNNNGVMTRPAWTPMHLLSLYKKYHSDIPLNNTEWLFDRIVNVPSGFSIQLNLRK